MCLSFWSRVTSKPHEYDVRGDGVRIRGVSQAPGLSPSLFDLNGLGLGSTPCSLNQCPYLRNDSWKEMHPILFMFFETLGSMVADSRASTDTKRLAHGTASPTVLL